MTVADLKKHLAKHLDALPVHVSGSGRITTIALVDVQQHEGKKKKGANKTGDKLLVLTSI